MLSNLSLFYLTKSINVKFRKKKLFDFSYATYVYREKMTKENPPPPPLRILTISCVCQLLNEMIK